MKAAQQQIERVIEQLFNTSADVVLTRPDQKFGDYATNVALQIAQRVGKNPREVADIICTAIKESEESVIADIATAGPGFINLTIADAELITALDSATKTNKHLQGKTVLAEYSDPNPFKVLHAGHLYTTIVGDVVSRLLEEAGASVHRLNFGGDLGLHVGKTMWAICKFIGGEYPEKLEKVPEAERLDWLSARYVEGNDAYEEDETAKAEIIAANARVYALHAEDDHDTSFAAIYWTCRAWSYDGFDRLYEQLAIKPFEKYIPESTVVEEGTRLVEQGAQQGVFVNSEGAVVFKGEEHGLHTRVFINSQGIPTYETKDLGLASQKWNEYNFDLSVIITANEQAEYMKVVLQAVSHFYPEAAERTRHLTHGIIKLPGGLKMSSRKGNILRATDIIEAAEQASSQTEHTHTHANILAAIKYGFLKFRIGGDVIYDPAESVAIEGNSGPYLQYAHARARSILSKTTASSKKATDITEGERILINKLLDYTDVITRATIDLSPHSLATYLYELSQEFNRFYEHQRVVGDPREGFRAQLVTVYAEVLRKGLDLLGIDAPEKM
jgi:arginyl-tRNA synthetase